MTKTTKTKPARSSKSNTDKSKRHNPTQLKPVAEKKGSRSKRASPSKAKPSQTKKNTGNKTTASGPKTSAKAAKTVKKTPARRRKTSLGEEPLCQPDPDFKSGDFDTSSFIDAFCEDIMKYRTYRSLLTHILDKTAAISGYRLNTLILAYGDKQAVFYNGVLGEDWRRDLSKIQRTINDILPAQRRTIAFSSLDMLYDNGQKFLQLKVKEL